MSVAWYFVISAIGAVAMILGATFLTDSLVNGRYTHMVLGAVVAWVGTISFLWAGIVAMAGLM